MIRKTGVQRFEATFKTIRGGEYTLSVSHPPKSIVCSWREDPLEIWFHSEQGRGLNRPPDNEYSVLAEAERPQNRSV